MSYKQLFTLKSSVLPPKRTFCRILFHFTLPQTPQKHLNILIITYINGVNKEEIFIVLQIQTFTILLH